MNVEFTRRSSLFQCDVYIVVGWRVSVECNALLRGLLVEYRNPVRCLVTCAGGHALATVNRQPVCGVVRVVSVVCGRLLGCDPGCLRVLCRSMMSVKGSRYLQYSDKGILIVSFVVMTATV